MGENIVPMARGKNKQLWTDSGGNVGVSTFILLYMGVMGVLLTFCCSELSTAGEATKESPPLPEWVVSKDKEHPLVQPLHTYPVSSTVEVKGVHNSAAKERHRKFVEAHQAKIHAERRAKSSKARAERHGKRAKKSKVRADHHTEIAKKSQARAELHVKRAEKSKALAERHMKKAAKSKALAEKHSKRYKEKVVKERSLSSKVVKKGKGAKMPR